MIGAVGIGGEVAVAVRVAQGLYMWTEEGGNNHTCERSQRALR